MKKEKPKFRLSRIEVVTKVYDEQSRVIKEKWEYWYPKDGEDQLPSAIGFDVENCE